MSEAVRVRRKDHVMTETEAAGMHLKIEQEAISQGMQVASRR